EDCLRVFVQRAERTAVVMCVLELSRLCRSHGIDAQHAAEDDGIEHGHIEAAYGGVQGSELRLDRRRVVERGDQELGAPCQTHRELSLIGALEQRREKLSLVRARERA